MLVQRICFLFFKKKKIIRNSFEYKNQTVSRNFFRVFYNRNSKAETNLFILIKKLPISYRTSLKACKNHTIVQFFANRGLTKPILRKNIYISWKQNFGLRTLLEIPLQPRQSRSAHNIIPFKPKSEPKQKQMEDLCLQWHHLDNENMIKDDGLFVNWTSKCCVLSSSSTRKVI